MKARKKSKFRSRKNGAKYLPRLAGSRCPEFKISAIQTDDLCLCAQGRDCRTPRTETLAVENRVIEVQAHLRMLQEMIGKISRPQYPIYREYHSGVSQLLRLFGVLQSEEAVDPDGLPTSFVVAETLIAKCISECLSGCPSRSRGMDKILSLVRDYRVVRPLQDGSCSVSLLRIHSILQDNYKDSYLCKLLDVILGCCRGVASRSVEL